MSYPFNETGALVANIIVTILTVALILFGMSNLVRYYAGLSEYKSTIGFYFFSTITLIC
jgi:hypothetical protein